MIIFLGDSYTWGQGLQIPYWLEQGKTIDEIDTLNPSTGYPAETYDYFADERRKKNHFPNIVAKYFNKSYATKFGNGGSNEDIFSILQNLNRHMYLDGIDFFVIQFTEILRGISDKKFMEYSNTGISPEEATQEVIKDLVDRINKKIHGFDKEWYGLSWKKEIGNFLSENYKQNFIPVLYDNKEFVSFDSIENNYTETRLIHKYGVRDGHFNERGHQVLANSIINKIEKLNGKIKKSINI